MIFALHSKILNALSLNPFFCIVEATVPPTHSWISYYGQNGALFTFTVSKVGTEDQGDQTHIQPRPSY